MVHSCCSRHLVLLFPCCGSPIDVAAWTGTVYYWSKHRQSALLQGQHPKHRDMSDPALLGTVERYFLEIMDIPRLQQRIDCFIFTRQFAPNVARVSSHLLACNRHLLAGAKCIGRQLHCSCVEVR